MLGYRYIPDTVKLPFSEWAFIGKFAITSSDSGGFIKFNDGTADLFSRVFVLVKHVRRKWFPHTNFNSWSFCIGK